MEITAHMKEEVIERLQRVAPELRKMGVERLSLFGSFVRNQTPDRSDVDIVVEFASGQ